MYTIAVLALMGLALFKLVDVIEELLPGLTRWHTVLTIVLGIAGTVAFDYSMTAGLKTDFRSPWMGTWLTGLAVTARAQCVPPSCTSAAYLFDAPRITSWAFNS